MRPIQEQRAGAGNETVTCPACGSEANWRNGHTPNGKQRFICRDCGRQHVPDASRRVRENRPSCPRCGRAMHVYISRGRITRFRCANYPDCRTYLKVTEQK